jgi:hypothetical protein
MWSDPNISALEIDCAEGSFCDLVLLVVEKHLRSGRG